MGRKAFDRQFKIGAVKLVLEDKIPVAEAAKALSIHSNSLYRWVNEYEQNGNNAFPGQGTALYCTQLEIKRLQRENKDLREELALLKKFRAFLKRKNA